jgi:hypothetical protein
MLLSVSGCQQPNNPLVAEAFHHKLYLSEVMEQLPYFASKEDSLLFMEQYVETWILHKTMLAQAKHKLTQKEQDFSPQMTQYQKQLLINSYLQKISRDSSLFAVSPTELSDFMNETKNDKVPEYRDMVKVNYIKFSNPSKLYYPIRKLFFDETDRVNALQQLELLCADTIEYYLDGEHWFYADFLENELPLKFSQTNSQKEFDLIQNGYRYLILLLDQKQQYQPNHTLDDIKMAQVFLQQQKKVSFFTLYQDSLVQKALLAKKAVKYPIAF